MKIKILKICLKKVFVTTGGVNTFWNLVRLVRTYANKYPFAHSSETNQKIIRKRRSYAGNHKVKKKFKRY